jgi:hypothetical protein
MDKYIKLKDIIDLLDSKITKMKEYVNQNNLSPYMKDKILDSKFILQQLKDEILEDNTIGEPND